MTQPNEDLHMWKVTGAREATIVCRVLEATGVDWTFEQLCNVGNTIIADAIETTPARKVDEWHEGFTTVFMPWLAGRMQGKN